MLFEHGTSQYVFLPFENQFGKQDTVSHWMLAGSSIQHLSDCRNLHLHRRILSTRYEDDFAGAFSSSAADIEISALELDASARCGTDAISQTKTIKSQTATILGFLWNTQNKTVTVSERIFRKVLRLLFLHTPSSPQINDRVSIVTLQRLGSYAIRLSSCLTCLLPFSRGFHAATCRVPFTCPYSKWTQRSIGELAIWRAAFTLSLHDYRWLEVPMFQIGILCYAPSDGDSSTSSDVRESNRSCRQAAIASLVGYGDACTTNNGLGVYIPDTLWMGMNFQPLSHLLLASGERRAIDINVLEFIAALLTSLALIDSLDKLPSITLRHIHIWTDNTACLSWMKKHKADHPLHLFLLYIFSFIQIKHRVLITLGHIPGVHNIYADASSRNFICPNGPSILRHLLQFPQWFAPPAFMTGIVLASALQSLDISQLVAAALTALELPTSSDFVPKTTLISTSPPQDLPNENMLFTSFLTCTRSATSLPKSSTNTLATFVPHSSNKALSRTAPNSALPDSTSCLSPSNEQNLLTPFVSVKESPQFSLLSPRLSSLSPNSSAPIPTLPLSSKHHLLRVTAAPFVPKNTSSAQSFYTMSPLPINCALLTAPSGGATVSGMYTTSTVAPPLESVDNFVSILDFNKNHQFGDGGPRSIGAAPAGVPFCLVKTLLSYFLRFGATINCPLLSSHGNRVTNTQVDRILKVVAMNLSLPLHKLTPASLRAGAPNQLIDFSEEFRCMQGAWKTTRGMQVYMREYLRKSMLTAPALHDPSIVPVSHLQFAHQIPIAR